MVSRVNPPDTNNKNNLAIEILIYATNTSALCHYNRCAFCRFHVGTHMWAQCVPLKMRRSYSNSEFSSKLLRKEARTSTNKYLEGLSDHVFVSGYRRLHHAACSSAEKYYNQYCLCEKGDDLRTQSILPNEKENKAV